MLDRKGPAPAEPAAVAAPTRRSRSRAGGRLVRVDRLTAGLAGLGLLLVVVATVFVTLLVARDDDSSQRQPPAGPTVTLNGPAVAAYISDSYAVSGVTCPSVPTVVGGSFLCSDPAGNSFTVQLIDHGRAYAVHPNQ